MKQLSKAMERKLRKRLKVDSHCLDLAAIRKEVLTDDDVLFYWSIVSSDWDEEVGEQR